MKKVIFLLVILAMVLSGCSSGEISAKEDEFVLDIRLDGITEDLYRVGISYFLAGDLMGGLATGYADQTPYREKAAAFRITPADLPEGRAPERFSFQVTVSFDRGGTGTFSSAEKIITSNTSEQFDAEYGNVYSFSLTGSYSDGLYLKAEQ